MKEGCRCELNRSIWETSGTAGSHYYYYYIRLTAFFQDNLGKPAPEKQNHSGKTNLDLLEQEIVSGSGISWAICKSAPRSRQITTPESHHSVFYRSDTFPAAQPTASKHWRQSNSSQCTHKYATCFVVCCFSMLLLLIEQQESIQPVKSCSSVLTNWMNWLTPAIESNRIREIPYCIDSAYSSWFRSLHCSILYCHIAKCWRLEVRSGWSIVWKICKS